MQLQKDLFIKHHNTADGRIKVWLGIRKIMNSTDRLLTETRDTAKELETGIHMVYLSQLKYNTRFISMKQRENGVQSSSILTMFTHFTNVVMT